MLGDAHVQLHVMAVDDEAELGVVVARRQPVEEDVDLRREPPDFEPLAGGRALREQPRRLALERLAQLVQLSHVGFAGNAYASPGPRPRFDQSGLLQPLQRVGHRQHAHPEVACEAAPRQRRARRKLSAQDPVTQRVIGLLGEGGQGGQGGVRRRLAVPGTPNGRHDD